MAEKLFPAVVELFKGGALSTTTYFREGPKEIELRVVGPGSDSDVSLPYDAIVTLGKADKNGIRPVLQKPPAIVHGSRNRVDRGQGERLSSFGEVITDNFLGLPSPVVYDNGTCYPPELPELIALFEGEVYTVSLDLLKALGLDNNAVALLGSSSLN